MNIEHLRRFLIESNKIEGITKGTTATHEEVSSRFLKLESVSVDTMEFLVSTFQPGAKLRDKPGIDAVLRYRNQDGEMEIVYRPPPGGEDISIELAEIVGMAQLEVPPFIVHHRYETTHPFTDGNGRSGRMLWLWQMLNQGHNYRPEWGFLKHFYFQSLEHGR